MNAFLPAETRTRLVRILGMLGNAHDGEALVAAALLDADCGWTGWELGFLDSLTRHRRLSGKQLTILRKLARRAGLEECL